MMDLRHVLAFCTINRLHSFSAAARALATTQPSISRRIRELERELGVVLFDTRSKRAALTAKGQEFLPHAEELLRMVDSIAEKMTESDCISGTVRLGASETIAMTWLSTFVENMRRAHPKVILAVDIDVADGLVGKYRAGLLDAVVVTPALRGEGTEVEDLGCFEYAWMASPAMDIPRRSLTPGELAIYPIISLSSASALYQMAVRWFRGQQAVPNWVNHCSSIGMVTTLTESALGISLLPPSLMQDRIAAGQLQVIEVDPPFPRLRFVVAYPSHATSPALHAVVHQLSESSTFPILEDGRT
jgi:DNA-binding transcriptional LysR family regulator